MFSAAPNAPWQRFKSKTNIIIQDGMKLRDCVHTLAVINTVKKCGQINECSGRTVDSTISVQCLVTFVLRSGDRI